MKLKIIAHFKISSPEGLCVNNFLTSLQIPPLLWCPLKMEVTKFIPKSDNVLDFEEKREVMEFPLPSNKEGFNYPNSAGFQYEAEAVRQCLIKGQSTGNLNS